MTRHYRWARSGDVNAFFGLVLDNLAGLIWLYILLSGRFGFPGEMVLTSLVPGTALGVLVGDLAFFWLSLRLAKRTGRDDVTAMPLGLDTPSTFGMIFFVLGPSFVAGRESLGLDIASAAQRTWHIGIWCVVLSGLFKVASAPVCSYVRRLVPRAGLLGSLAAIALVLISFMPILEVFAHPLPGMLALAIVLTTLIGRVPLPGNLPGTLGALLVAGTIYYVSGAVGVAGYHLPEVPTVTWLPVEWMQAWSFGWLSAFDDAAPYLPIAFPFALATIVGGIDCTESAAAAGDEYDTRHVIAIEGMATLLAGLSGGVIQTTPYIGHPAYKVMGGRAGYTLATALVIGSAGIIGYFSILNAYLPAPVVFPILVFVGLEITAQSFYATPRRHYAAVALACVPALAFLALAFPGQLFGDGTAMAANFNPSTLADPDLKQSLSTLTMLSNGFILTSLLWAWALSSIIDRRIHTAALVFAAAGVLTLFGLIHSPLAESRLFLPVGPQAWGTLVLDAVHRAATLEYAAGYLACAMLLAIWGWLVPLANSGVVCDHESLVHEAVAARPSGSKEPGQATGPIARVLEPEVMDDEQEASEYDRMNHAEVNRAFVDDLIAGGSVGSRVVDLGTGTALIPIELCQRLEDVRVMAIDASVEMLDIARRRLELAGMIERIQLLHADAKRLDDLEAGMAETVISNSLIHHLPEPRQAIAAAVRIAVPGGRIFIRDLVRPETSAEVDRLVDLQTRGESAMAIKMFRDSLHAALTLQEARELFASFGFSPGTVRMTSDRHWTFDSASDANVTGAP
ncbi:MAG: class I SAM-dependent methyltransferase [Planctomycetaceae bacterium]